MKIALFLAAALLAGCASHPSRPAARLYFTPPDPSVVGKTTEAELIARRGPPLNLMTGSDGTRTYLYYSFITKVADFKNLAKTDPAEPGSLALADGSNGLPETKIEYVFSPNGLLRETRMEVPSLGTKS